MVPTNGREEGPRMDTKQKTDQPRMNTEYADRGQPVERCLACEADRVVKRLKNRAA